MHEPLEKLEYMPVWEKHEAIENWCRKLFGEGLIFRPSPTPDECIDVWKEGKVILSYPTSAKASMIYIQLLAFQKRIS